MERLLTMDKVLQAVPFSRPYLYVLMKRGEFPRPLKLGQRRVAWRERDIRAWIEAKSPTDPRENEVQFSSLL